MWLQLQGEGRRRTMARQRARRRRRVGEEPLEELWLFRHENAAIAWEAAAIAWEDESGVKEVGKPTPQQARAQSWFLPNDITWTTATNGATITYTIAFDIRTGTLSYNG